MGAAATVTRVPVQFGGACVSHPHLSLSSLYQIDLSTLQCRELVPTNGSPVPKKGSRMVYFNEKLVVYGGYLAEGAVSKTFYDTVGSVGPWPNQNFGRAYISAGLSLFGWMAKSYDSSNAVSRDPQYVRPFCVHAHQAYVDKCRSARYS